MRLHIPRIWMSNISRISLLISTTLSDKLIAKQPKLSMCLVCNLLSENHMTGLDHVFSGRKARW